MTDSQENAAPTPAVQYANTASGLADKIRANTLRSWAREDQSRAQHDAPDWTSDALLDMRRLALDLACATGTHLESAAIADRALVFYTFLKSE